MIIIIILQVMLLSVTYISASPPPIYQANPSLQWQFTPSIERTDNLGYRYSLEAMGTNVRLYFGRTLDTNGTYGQPKSLYNSQIFEGSEIDIAEGGPPVLNFGK